ncbi:hypothetical protein Sjap_011793 [Stephania japonica]|uniref:Aminopeptidase n=1 Tax=Stephania japonica TaxID=461633 RepID=A0AAP0P8D8_9MAGN
MDQIEQFKSQTRLPTFAIPKHYDLKLKINLSACTFEGIVDITLDIVEETKFLVLNVLELTVSEVTFKGSDHQEVCPSDVLVEKDDEILVLVFNGGLAVGEGILGIKFSGVLNEHMKGLYRSTYYVGEKKKNMAVTQFAAVETRRCFPCWDEPALKATFKITVEVPPELMALSNMPVIEEKINGDVKTIYFDKSPLMSCYLVALVIGELDHIEERTSDGTIVRVYCSLGKTDSGRFALKIAIKSLEIYKNFFSMPYPLPKLDLASVPDFAAGAMENYGLIIYREQDLLCDEFHSSASNKQRVAVVAAHEVGHMWYGDLVTMEWWTDIWLNEGFATWVSYLAVDTFFPEWKMWDQFLAETADGLKLDALEESHPIEVEVCHPRSLDEVFDAISYNKGCGVIRMLQGYLGHDTFQRSLASYMKRYAWKSTKTKDLWDVINEESGIDVNNLMNTWTKQKGYPVLYVKLEDHTLEFNQSHFLSSGSHGDGQWIVPVTICFGSYSTCKSFLLETKSEKMDISDILSSLDDHTSSAEKINREKVHEQIWIKVNVEQTGFYRVKYDDILATQLKKAIKAGYLSPSDRFGVLDDSYALSEACELPLSALLSLIVAYAKELDYIVLSRLIEICSIIANISKDAFPNSSDKLICFFNNLLSFSAEKLGWDLVSGESHLNSLLRSEVLTALAMFGHNETQNEATKRFHAFVEDRNTSLLPPDTRRVAYVAVMKNTTATNRTGFESVLNLYRDMDVGQEKSRLLRTMACSSDPNIVLEALNFSLSSEVREQDVIFGLRGISFEGREVAWCWLKENWDLIWKRWGSSLIITNFIRDIVSLFSSEEMAEEVEAFFETRISPSIARTLKQKIEQIRIKARWIKNIKKESDLEELVDKLAQWDKFNQNHSGESFTPTKLFVA